MERYVFNVIVTLICLGCALLFLTMLEKLLVTTYAKAEVHGCLYVAKWLPNKSRGLYFDERLWEVRQREN